jgi:hypothetical protein
MQHVAVLPLSTAAHRCANPCGAAVFCSLFIAGFVSQSTWLITVTHFIECAIDLCAANKRDVL